MLTSHVPFPLIETITSNDRRRFFLKYHRLGPNDCWLWFGGTIHNQSGEFRGCFRLKGQIYLANRVAYFFKYDIDPEELQVCHTCDTGLCVNWNHLWLGTSSENNQDCHSKGRNNKVGESNGRNLLSEEQVRMIRESNNSCIELGKQFGVSKQTIQAARSGKNWKHLN